MKRALLIIFVLPLLVLAQDYEHERAEQQARLDELRGEIAEVEAIITQALRDEADLADVIAHLDEKLTLRKRLIRELENDMKLTEAELVKIANNIDFLRGEICGVEATIDSLIEDIAELEGLVRKRAIYAYKNWYWDEIRLILTAEDFNQALVRKKYFNLIATRDNDNMYALQEKKSQLSSSLLQKRSLEATLLSEQQEMADHLQYKKDLIEEALLEEKKLISEKTQKESLLQRIRNDHAALQRELQIKKSAAEEIERLIALLEQKALAEVDISERFPDLDFPKLKGRMEWPIEGEVISHFGRQHNPSLNTWTENTGIDIDARKGSAVRAVASGKVTVITWLRGYGSTLIISHPDGYYTVYTHLDEILVNPQSYVTGGSVIATVGDSGSLEGVKLHFEVWEKRVKQDPEKWLRKRG